MTPTEIEHERLKKELEILVQAEVLKMKAEHSLFMVWATKRFVFIVALFSALIFFEMVWPILYKRILP